VDTESQKPYFLNYESDKHLVLSFNDITVSHDDISSKQRTLTARLIQFITNHDMRYPLLIHCTLGISRSTAAAYIALNVYHKNKELQIAHYLRSKIPYAIPNMTLVSVADSLLGSNGHMIEAIEALTVPQMSHSGGCKMLSTDFE
jgi:predicted protein tyrosine phosphatase